MALARDGDVAVAATLDKVADWLVEAELWRDSRTYGVEVDHRGTMISACADAADATLRLAEFLYVRHRDSVTDDRFERLERTVTTAPAAKRDEER